MKLTWSCMICGRERDDADIGVASGVVILPRSGVEMTQNVRFCRDNPDCEAAAQAQAQATPEWA